MKNGQVSVDRDRSPGQAQEGELQVIDCLNPQLTLR
jgi:hypothetical protein